MNGMARIRSTWTRPARWMWWGTQRPISTTRTPHMPMKPGTPIPGLDIFKDKDPPVALERSEYPEWVNELEQPLISLAKLRKMPQEEATDEQIKRYLRLVRRMKIKERNEASRKD